MVEFETILPKPALAAPLPEARHQHLPMELVLDPASHRLPIAPQRGEPISPIRASPDDRVKTAVDRACFSERLLEVSPKLDVAALRTDELGNDEKRLRLRG
jgi:hypothetical protein